jgi:hypothetical protein
MLSLSVVACGDGDSVPVDRQQESVSTGGGGQPATTFSAPLPSDNGSGASDATDAEDESSDDGQEPTGTVAPAPPPDVKPPQIEAPPG